MGVFLPDLHAPTTGAHVFPQQQAVEGRGSDEVGQVVENLLHLGGGQSLVGQSCVKSSQLPQHRRHSGNIACDPPGV